jgi:uncharacterized membrane protein
MEYLIAIIVLLCAIPVGYLLKYETKEELKSGKKYFRILCISSAILALLSLIIKISQTTKKTLVFSFIFISIISFISWKTKE